jgi:hypothetical protein
MQLFRVLSRNFRHPATISRPSSLLFGTNSSLCLLLGGMKNGGIMRLSLCVQKRSSRNSWRDYAAVVSRALVQYLAYAAITRTIFLPARMRGYFLCTIVRGYQFKRLFPVGNGSQQSPRAAMPQCLVISRTG